jgi:hypothetical protein
LKIDNMIMENEGYVKIDEFGIWKEGMGYGDRNGKLWGKNEFLEKQVLNEK